jgi:hypothetical protein
MRGVVAEFQTHLNDATAERTPLFPRASSGARVRRRRCLAGPAARAQPRNERPERGIGGDRDEIFPRAGNRRPRQLHRGRRVDDGCPADGADEVRRGAPELLDRSSLRPRRRATAGRQRADAPPVGPVRDGLLQRPACVLRQELILAAAEDGGVEAGIGCDLELVLIGGRDRLPGESRQRIDDGAGRRRQRRRRGESRLGRGSHRQERDREQRRKAQPDHASSGSPFFHSHAYAHIPQTP